MDIFSFMDYLAKKNIPTVYGMIDEYPYLGYCCYAYECEQFKTGCQNCRFPYNERYLKSYFFNRAAKTLKMKEKTYNRFKKIVFTGPEWVVQRAKESILLKNKDVRVVDEFVDTKETFVVRNTANLRKELNISDDKVVLVDVAPSQDERKGVKFFIELAGKFVDNHKYVFVNVGYQNNFENLPSNFIGIPFVKDQNMLAEYYSLADLFVCTSMADTMPNTCLDALACGTPVCGFEITGVPYVAQPPLGQFVKPCDVDAMAQIVSNTCKKDSAMVEACREYAVARYSLDTYYNKQILIYEELLKGR
jgi:glycosyltransferase involved in cell wall biosynthesis